MDYIKLLPLLIEKIDWILVISAAFVLVILHLFFKNRFQTQPDLLKYSRYGFFILFYVLGAVGFISLTALDEVFHRGNRFFISPYVIVIPYAVISGLVGSLVGYIIYKAASKTVPQAVYLVVNLSLVVISVPTTYLLLVKPFNQTLIYVDPIGKHFNKNAIKLNHCKLVKSNYADEHSFNETQLIECLPSEPNDEFEVLTDGSNQLFINKKKSKAISIRNISYHKIYETKTCFLVDGGNRYLVVLSILTPQSGYSVLHLFDMQARCVYEEVFDDFIWGLYNFKTNKIVLSKQKMNDNGYFETKWFVYGF